jgi:hypothetical protein
LVGVQDGGDVLGADDDDSDDDGEDHTEDTGEPSMAPDHRLDGLPSEQRPQDEERDDGRRMLRDDQPWLPSLL